MRIAILYNGKPSQLSCEIEAEYDSELTIKSMMNTLLTKHDVVLVPVDRDFGWVFQLLSSKVDIVINVCEGYRGPARESVYPAILEQLSIPYVGPDSTNLLICHNKFLTKVLLTGLCDMPRYSLIKPNGPVPSDILFPAIVKLNTEGSSIGLSSSSIVHNNDELIEQIERISNVYKQNIIVEQYIAGRDVSVAYVEGIGILGPCGIDYDSEIYDYNYKTKNDEFVTISPLYGNHCSLKEIAEKIVKRIDLRGYGKIDFRYSDGKYYFIEVNGQVSFHPEGEFIICAKRDGYKLDDLLNHMIHYAYSQTRERIFSAGVGDFSV